MTTQVKHYWEGTLTLCEKRCSSPSNRWQGWRGMSSKKKCRICERRVKKKVMI
jgi:hypothetical protein